MNSLSEKLFLQIRKANRVVDHKTFRRLQMKKSMVLLSVVAICALTGMVTQSLSAKEITLTYATFFPSTHVQSKLAESWAKEIEKRTSGKVKITYYPGGSLLKGAEIWDGITKGIADIGMSFPAWNRGRFPALEAIDLPFGYKNARVAIRVTNEFVNKFKLKELDDVKILYLMAQSPGILHTKKPINKLEDLKGVKIRAGGTVGKFVSYLGATPVAMPAEGSYEALEKGIVSGTLGPYEQLKGWRIADVTKYTVENWSTAFSSSLYVAMNKAKWNALPEDVKEIFTKVSAEYLEKHTKAWDDSDTEGRGFALKQGHQIMKQTQTESDRWAQAVQPLFKEYIDYATAKGLPAKDYVDFIRKAVDQENKKK